MSALETPEIRTLPPEGLVLRNETEVVSRRVPSRSHRFYLGLALLVAVVAGAALARTYFARLASERWWLYHLYNVLLAGWVALFVTQVTLVYRRHTPTHRKLGLVGVGYALLVFVLGLVATFVEPMMHVAAGEWSTSQAASFLLLPLGDLLLFASFFAGSIIFRYRAAVHKRLMLLASIALLLAPIERTIASSLVAMCVVWLSPLTLSIGYDLWRRKRIHVANLVGAAVLVLSFTRVPLMHDERWLTIGRSIVQSLLPIASGKL